MYSPSLLVSTLSTISFLYLISVVYSNSFPPIVLAFAPSSLYSPPISTYTILFPFNVINGSSLFNSGISPVSFGVIVIFPSSPFAQ